MLATLEELDEDALIQILTEPKNALIKQYQRLFHMEGVELEVRTTALGAVAKRALARKTGARGLRSILEQILLDTMYELPTLENVSKVVVDESMVSADGKPLLIYSDQPEGRRRHGLSPAVVSLPLGSLHFVTVSALQRKAACVYAFLIVFPGRTRIYARAVQPLERLI